MPTVKNLLNSTPAAPTGGQHKPIAVTERDADLPLKPTTPGVLVTEGPPSAALGAKLALPSFVTQLPDTLPDPEDKATYPFLAFASPRASKWPAQQAAGCRDGDPYLSVDGQIVSAVGVKLWLFQAAEYATRMASNGSVTAATKDMAKADYKLPPGDRHDEHYVAVCVADVAGRLVPVKAEFRGTKNGGVTPLIRGVKQAAQPEWVGLSDAHRVAAAYPYPFGRVTGVVATQKKVSKSSGNAYYAASCTVTPTTVTDMQRLADALQDDAFVAGLHVVGQAYATRVEELNKLAGV